MKVCIKIVVSLHFLGKNNEEKSSAHVPYKKQLCILKNIFDSHLVASIDGIPTNAEGWLSIYINADKSKSEPWIKHSIAFVWIEGTLLQSEKIVALACESQYTCPTKVHGQQPPPNFWLIHSCSRMVPRTAVISSCFLFSVMNFPVFNSLRICVNPWRLEKKCKFSYNLF